MDSKKTPTKNGKEKLVVEKNNTTVSGDPRREQSKCTNKEASHAWELIRMVNDTIIKIREIELSEYGISQRHAAVLHVIKRMNNAATPTQIAQLTLREIATILSMLKRMELLGLVTKKLSNNRYKQEIFSLTKKGESAYQNAMKRQSIERIMSRVNYHDFTRFVASLESIWDIALSELGIAKRQKSAIGTLSALRNLKQSKV